MKLPKFLLGDNSNYPNDIFVIHTEFPRFIINLVNDEVEWFEDFDDIDRKELELQVASLIEEASTFYDQEIESYDPD